MATPTVYVICDQNCKFESMTKEQILTAIAQAVETGEISDVDTGFVTTIKTISGTPLRFFVGEQSEYDALTEEDKKNLFAIISNDTTKEGILAYLEELNTSVNNVKANLVAVNANLTAAIETEKEEREAATPLAQKYTPNYEITTIPVSGVRIELGDLPSGRSKDDILAICASLRLTLGSEVFNADVNGMFVGSVSGTELNGVYHSESGAIWTVYVSLLPYAENGKLWLSVGEVAVQRPTQTNAQTITNYTVQTVKVYFL